MQGLSHPLKPTAFVGKRAAWLRKAAICERQLNEAGQSWGNFMSIVDDLPPAEMQSPSHQMAEGFGLVRSDTGKQTSKARTWLRQRSGCNSRRI